jgi:hypothetical protein
LSAGVAIKVDNDRDLDGWTRLLEAFEIDEIYELPGLGVPLGGSIGVENLGQIGNYHPAPLIAIQPKDADFIQGVTPLLEFNHPDEAIYVFGGTMTRLTRGDCLGATLAATVYITELDLYPAEAGAIILWDRYLKATW